MTRPILLLLGLVFGTALAVHDSVLDVASFTGFRVYRVLPASEEDFQLLDSLQASPFYDFWTEIRHGRPVDIMVPPGKVGSLESDLTGLSYSIMIPDVQKVIDLEKVASSSAGHKLTADHPMTWTEYHPVEDMHAFLDYLESTYPDLVSTESIGSSGEGRDMRIAKVCAGGCGNKKAVWIDGGIHAREWISPATVTWMLNELLENPENADLIEGFDRYFLPSANPGGYAFSQDKNRMWRKTRSDHGSILNCMGVDANRNWGFHWNEGGSDNDKCSDTYHGPAAFSEPENVNVRDFINANKEQIVFYNSIHSYSQLILLPWGYTRDPPADYNELYALAMKGSDALTATHGKVYEVGCIPCLLYIASGSSADWAHGDAGIKFTTSMELRDTGVYGFLLPPAQIIPTAEETWAFHTTVIRELLNAN